ncbi:MAG: hypothetical protein J6Z49_06750 [Kiritimatiellae bacterium]|nr:hypothetical protein [Kiritimatiellia bacterium]
MNGSAYSRTVVLLSLLGLGMITPAQSRELSEEDEALVRKMIASSYFAREIWRVVKAPRLAEKLIRADIDTPHHASERRFKRIAEIFRKRDEEAIEKIEAGEKRRYEEWIRQQRERNREILEEREREQARRGKREGEGK